MTTTQSEDPNEQVDHPRHYNQHQSGVETIEIIEHLPANLSHAVKYVWRCGLKSSSAPIRDLQSALWYVDREIERRRLFDLDTISTPTDIVWRSLARRVISVGPPDDLVVRFLRELIAENIVGLSVMLNNAITEAAARTRSGWVSVSVDGEVFGSKRK